MQNENNGFSRRDFLKLSAAAAAAAALPELAGCSSIPERNLPDIDYSRPVRITNCNVVDTFQGAILPGMTITVEKGKIASMEPYRPEHNARFTSINADGKYVIPGLIDAHCHLTIQSCGHFRMADLMRQVRQIKRNGMMQIDAGVTTVRDTGSFPSMLHDLMAEYGKGSLVGPRVVYCNGIVNIDGGHPDIKSSDISVFGPATLAFTGRMNLEYTSRADLMKKMEENLEGGASFIKLTMDDHSLICGRGKIPVYSDDDLKAIFNFAQKKGKPVVIHSLMLYGLRRGIGYPLHSTEHISADGFLSGQDILAMARRNIAIVPTMIVGQNFSFRERFDSLPAEYRTPFIENELKIKYDYLKKGEFLGYDPQLHELNMASISWLRDPGCREMPKQKKFMTDPDLAFRYLVHGPSNLMNMKSAGVLIGCGTDSGVPFHYHGSLCREMEMMTRIGFSAYDVLRCATYNNALILGMADSIGAVRPGYHADLVVLENNPYLKLETCRSPLLVMGGGRVKYFGPSLQPVGAPGMSCLYRL